MIIFLVCIMGMIDPNLRKYHYEFKKDGAISLSLGDSLTKDSSRYEWNKKGQFIWKEYPADTSGNIFIVSMSGEDSLLLQSEDSVILTIHEVEVINFFLFCAKTNSSHLFIILN